MRHPRRTAHPRETCRDTGKELSAVRLVNLEELIIFSSSPLVVSEIAVSFTSICVDVMISPHLFR